MNYWLSGELDTDRIESFCEFANQVEPSVVSHIYLDSDGGSIAVASAITDILNRRPQDFVLHAVGNVASGAFRIFFDFKGKRTVDKYCHAVLHAVTINIESRSLRTNGAKEKNLDIKIAESIVLAEEKHLKDLMPYLTSGELECLNHGGDVFLDAERIQEIISKQEQEQVLFT